METVSRSSRQMSWQKPRERVSLLADLAIRRDTVSRKLTELRELHAGPDGKPLAQEKAAQRVGVSVRQWQRWEAGESVPYPRNLGVIAEHFDFDVGEFYDDERPNLKVVDGDRGKLDQILGELANAKLDRAAALENLKHAEQERVSMQRLIDAQNKLLERQAEILAKMEARLQALEAVDRALEALQARAAEAQPEPRRRYENGGQ